MEYLKKLFNQIYTSKASAFFGFLGLNILGNTIPIWFILLINFIEKGINYNTLIESIHQPFTFLVLGGTLLSNTLFLWQKDLKEKNSNQISTSMLIYIFISLPLFGYLFIKTYNTPNDTVKTGYWIASYIVSFLAFFTYIKYQYKDFDINWKKQNMTKSLKTEQKESFDGLNNSFDNFKEEQDGE